MKSAAIRRPIVEFKRENVTSQGVFSGYGAVFSNVDSYGDAIAPGAFTNTLAAWKAKGKLPKMLLQHGGGFGSSAEDGIPIGEWTSMAQDKTGLHVEGRLFALETEKAQYILEGLKSGALDGLSIGYIAVGVKYGQGSSDPERTLTEVDLFEVSVVTFPANDSARVDQVKAEASYTTVRDLEQALRDGRPFSRRQAKQIASAAFGSLTKSTYPDETASAAVDLIRRQIAALNNSR